MLNFGNRSYSPDSRPPTNLIVVSKRDIEESSFELSKSIDGIQSTIVSTMLGICIKSAVLRASTALAPQPFLRGVSRAYVCGLECSRLPRVAKSVGNRMEFIMRESIFIVSIPSMSKCFLHCICSFAVQSVVVWTASSSLMLPSRYCQSCQ